METWEVATTLIAAYLGVTLLLGVLANRRLTVDVEDFMLYGRKAGFIVLYLTIVATFHSAFAFLGSAGFFYTHGIGFWAAGAWTLLAGAITYVLGTRIWALGKAFGYVTPADLLADFYESELVRVTVALVSWSSPFCTSRFRRRGSATSSPSPPEGASRSSVGPCCC